MTTTTRPAPAATAAPPDRKYLLERVDDAAVVQLYADGFRDLPLREKTLVWHLTRRRSPGATSSTTSATRTTSRCATCSKRSSRIRTASMPATLDEIQRYTKLFWINTGPYNNLTARKFVLTCTPEAFAAAAQAAAQRRRDVPARRPARRSISCSTRLQPMFFDPDVDPIVTNKTPPAGQGHPHRERQQPLRRRDDGRPRGLQRAARAQLAAREERTASSSKRSTASAAATATQIAAIVSHLEAAIPFATEPMAKALRALITFYQTGETADREAYDIAWVQDKASPVDTINGFIEVYLDARGIKGAWEALVFYVNHEKTSRDPDARRATRSGSRTTCRGIRSTASRACRASPPTPSTSSIETGDSGPVTPVGINLPNDQAIREQLRQQVGVAVERQRGVRQVDAAGVPQRVLVDAGGGRARATKWSALAGELTTEHARGDRPRVGQGRRAAERQPAGGAQGAVLGARGGARRSGRAVLPARSEARRARPRRRPPITTTIVRAEYEAYARNALVQLRRVREGTQIEEDHMRNRQMIVRWLMAQHEGDRRRARATARPTT